MRGIKKLSPIALLITGLGIAIGAMAGGNYGKAEKDIVSVATEAGSFTTLITALDAASLTSVLEGEGPFTVFAPTDEAFAALPEGALEGLLANPVELAKVLTLHVVSGEALAALDVMSVAMAPWFVQAPSMCQVPLTTRRLWWS